MKNLYIFLICCSSFLAGISTDIYLPSLPAMAEHFRINSDLSQLTITAFVIAIGIGQLIVGPLTDAFGRKKLIILGLCVQIFALLAIIFSSTIYMVINARFIQGLGVALLLVPVRAIISDVFESKELKIVFAYAAMTFSIGPIVGPFIGGYTEHYFYWQMSFEVLLVYVMILWCLMTFFYRESAKTFQPLAIRRICNNYKIVLRCRQFLMSALFSGIAWGIIGMFNVIAPFLIQNTMGYNALTFGYVAFVLGIGWFLGMILNRMLINLNRQIKTQASIACISLAIMMLVSCGYFSMINLYTLVIAVFMMAVSTSFVFPVYTGVSITLFPQISGTANACMFSLVWTIFGLFTAFAAMLPANTIWPLLDTYVIINIALVVIYYFYLHVHEQFGEPSK